MAGMPYAYIYVKGYLHMVEVPTRTNIVSDGLKIVLTLLTIKTYTVYIWKYSSIFFLFFFFLGGGGVVVVI